MMFKTFVRNISPIFPNLLFTPNCYPSLSSSILQLFRRRHAMPLQNVVISHVILALGKFFFFFTLHQPH